MERLGTIRRRSAKGRYLHQYVGSALRSGWRFGIEPAVDSARFEMSDVADGMETTCDHVRMVVDFEGTVFAIILRRHEKGFHALVGHDGRFPGRGNR